MMMSGEGSSIIQRLPQELRSSILSYCESSSILKLCLTSRAMYTACIPSLFHTMDLSTHNSLRWERSKDIINLNVPADHAQRSSTLEVRFISHRQRKLIRLLKEHPDLAKATRTLKWTLNADVPRTSRSSPHEFNYGNLELWRTFACFTKVTEIDLAFMTNWREVDPPPALFHTATSINIAGVVSYAVLASIFNSVDPAKLRHLRLNNVQTFADPNNILETLSESEISAHRRGRPGPSYGWLATLKGRCPVLRSFHFLTTAEFVDQSRDTFPPPNWQLEVRGEHNRYAELADFIDSVKPTLRELVFEHGPDIDYFFESPGRHTIRAFEGPSHDIPLPMDTYFVTHVLPVLASGPWPKLKKMVIRGIGHWKPIHPWREGSTVEEIRYLHTKTRESRDRAEMIWDVVGGDSIDVCIEDSASRPFYRFQADRRREMTGLLGD